MKLVAAMMIPSLLIGTAGATTFEERWNEMLAEYALRHAAEGAAGNMPKIAPVITPETRIAEHSTPSRHVTHRHHGRRACRHVWHGKHWRC